MTTKPIEESGMTFGPFAEGQCFHVEKSRCYAAIQRNVKIAEFLLLRPRQNKPQALWVVEAKSSTPRPETQPNFDTFIAHTREKMVNTFSLTWAACLGRHPKAQSELPNAFQTLDLSKVQVTFVLVIKGHDEKYLSPLSDALRNALRTTTKTWALGPNPVVVLNDKMAMQKGLIASEAGGDA